NSPITADESLSWQKFLRFFIGLKIGGHDRIAAALNDPALEMFAGMNAQTFREACSQQTNSLAAMQDACINNLIEQLHRQGIYLGRHLAIEAVPMGDRGNVVLVVRDLPRDVWLYAECIRPDPYLLQNALNRALETSGRIVGSAPEWLLVRSGDE